MGIDEDTTFPTEDEIILPLRLSSPEMVESPRRRLLVPLPSGLTLRVLPSHKRPGMSSRLDSMPSMPMVMVSLPLRKSELPSHHQRRERRDQREVPSSD